MNNYIEDKLYRLSKSKFRDSFHLNKKMVDYCNIKGLDVVKSHAYDFIKARIAPAVIPNDGKQTPTRQVHPVFIAQHATACCCRGCLYKWHHIEMNKELSDLEIDFIVELICKWIEKDVKYNK